MAGDLDALEREEQLRQLLIEAGRLLRQSQLVGAKGKLQQALELQPDSAEALELMGQLEVAGGNFDGAMDYFRKVAFDLPEAPTHVKRRAEERLGEAALMKAQGAQSSGDATSKPGGIDLKPTSSHKPERSPSVAAALSLLMPGMGEFYARSRTKGLLIVGLWMLVLMGLVVAALDVLTEMQSALSGYGNRFWGMFAIYLGVWKSTGIVWVLLDHLLRIGSAVDAALTAGGGGEDEF